MGENTELSQYYEKPMKVRFPWWNDFASKVIKNVPREEAAALFGYKGGSCLDVACGDGELINGFLSKSYNRLVGVDISVKEITTARKNSKNNAKFYLSNLDSFLNSTIKRREKFDDVYMLAILEHIFWPKTTIEKISIIVRKGGRVVVEVPNVAWLPHRISLLLGRFPETAPTIGAIPGIQDEHIRFFTPSSLDKIFSQAGFVRVKLDCSGRFINVKRLWIDLLSPDILAVYKKK